MLEVATEADTDAETDARYAGAIAMSAPGEPSVTVVHPTTAIRTVATQPAARAAPPQPGHPNDPIRTG
jgi:hypothetical protein